MKRIGILIMALMMMALFAASAMAAERPNLDVSILSYTPVPAQPGSYVTMTLKILNNGDAATTAATIEFVDNYPFSIDNAASRTKNIGILGVQETYLAEYKVRIDAEALEGTNYIKVRYKQNAATDSWVEKELPLTISSSQKTLTINNVDIQPKSITPGGEGKIDLKVKNLASANVRDVGVKLNLEGVVFGTTYVDIPLAPIGSSVEKRISLLKNGQTADFEFVLQAYPEAAAGIYKVPVTLTYTDESGNEYSRVDLISVVINSKTDLMVSIDEAMLYSDNGKGDVSFMITNRGLAEIKFLTVTLQDSDAYDVKSVSNAIYIGNVDSDDYEIATFTVQMTKQGLDMVEFPLLLEYKDALNNEQTKQATLSMPLISTKDAGQEKSKTGLIVVIVIVLAFIVFFVMRARRKKARHH